MTSKKEIGARLRTFAEEHYPSMVAFAEAMGVSASQINDYLSGRRTPGNSMQTRLRDLKCDIEWLMTGKEAGSVVKAKKHADREPLYQLNATGPVSPEFKKRLAKLARRLKNLKPEEFDKIDKLLDLYLDGKDSK